MNLYEGIKNNLVNESSANFGIKDIRRAFKDAGLFDIKEIRNTFSRTYTISGLYTVNVNKQFNNILFKSYDLPLYFIVYVIKSGEGAMTRTGAYSIKIIGADRGLDVINDVSVYSKDGAEYTTTQIKESISDYVDTVNDWIFNALEKEKDYIFNKNEHIPTMTLNKFITVVRDCITNKEGNKRDETYAPTNVVAEINNPPKDTTPPAIKTEQLQLDLNNKED